MVSRTSAAEFVNLLRLFLYRGQVPFLVSEFAICVTKFHVRLNLHREDTSCPGFENDNRRGEDCDDLEGKACIEVPWCGQLYSYPYRRGDSVSSRCGV